MPGFRSTNSILRSTRGGDLAEAEARMAKRLGIGAPMPTRTHQVALEVFEEMMTMGVELAGRAGDDAPAQLRMLMRMINESRPLLAKHIAKAPARELREFMGMLGAKIQRIVDEPEGGPNADPAPDANGAVTDRATA